MQRMQANFKYYLCFYYSETSQLNRQSGKLQMELLEFFRARPKPQWFGELGKLKENFDISKFSMFIETVAFVSRCFISGLVKVVPDTW